MYKSTGVNMSKLDATSLLYVRHFETKKKEYFIAIDVFTRKYHTAGSCDEMSK